MIAHAWVLIYGWERQRWLLPLCLICLTRYASGTCTIMPAKAIQWLHINETSQLTKYHAIKKYETPSYWRKNSQLVHRSKPAAHLQTDCTQTPRTASDQAFVHMVMSQILHSHCQQPWLCRGKAGLHCLLIFIGPRVKEMVNGTITFPIKNKESWFLSKVFGAKTARGGERFHLRCKQ